MKKKRTAAYIGLIFVIFLWGAAPLITLFFYKYYSPTMRVAFGSLTSGIAMLLIARKKIGLLNKNYFKIAIPTGVCLGLADILQKIGLQYTTPTNYAFLENLSVVTVPLVLFFLVRKKPTPQTVVAVALCLVSSLVLTGVLEDGGSFGKGDILCALAGMLYGVNIAVTGRYAGGVCVPLYLSIQLLTVSMLGFASTALLAALEIEPFYFTFRLGMILLLVLFVLVSSTLGWLIRTAAMKQVDPTVVAVMMPFSSVVTVFISVLSGTDTLSPSLIVGAALGLVAIVLAGIGSEISKSQQHKSQEDVKE